MTGSFSTAGPAAAFSDTGGGRVGGALQPLGLTSGVSSLPPPAGNPAPPRDTGNESEPAKPRARKRTPAEPAPKPQHRPVEEPEPATPSHPHTAPEKTPPHERSVSEGKDYKESKDVMVTTAQNPWHAELGAGYYTDYQSFRGVNILDVVTPEHGGSGGVIFSSVKLGYARKEDSITFGFNYWQALNRTYAKGPIYDVPPNKTKKDGTPRRDNEEFRLPSRDRYEEYNINVTYTRNFWDDKLVGSIGYNRFMFSNGNFWNAGEGPIPHADELMFGLAYTALPYIQPSINYSIDFDGFIGSYLELRLDGVYNLYQKPGSDFAIRLRPYVALSYDFAYNGSDNGFNAVEIGLNVPIRLNNFLTLTLTSNYVQPIDKSDGQPRASDGLWAGIKLTADWGGPSAEFKNLPLTGKDKDAKIEVAPLGEKKWEITTGAGWRKIDFSYDHRGVSEFPVDRLFEGRHGRDPIGLAGAGSRVLYDDGVVDARGTGTTGVAAFAVKDADSQINGALGNNAQVRFTTTAYDYDQTSTHKSGVQTDTDGLFSPYIQGDRELWRSGLWSLRAGLLYAYTGSSSDSGYHLARLDTVTQHQNTTGYVYSFDNFDFATAVNSGLATSNMVITDEAAAAATSLTPFDPRLRPGKDFTGTTQNVVSVGTFVRSSIDLDAHDLALPLSFRYDFGNRIHAEVTVAPTVTLANAELKTEIENRSFSDFPQPIVEKRQTIRGLPPSTGFAGLGFGGSTPPASAPPAPAAAAPQGGAGTPVTSGKGSTPQNPRYPGTLVGKQETVDHANAILFGVSAGASIIVDLNQEQTFFAELYGKYHWVQSFSMDDSFGQANIDLTSFQVGVGLGYRF